MNKVLSSHYEEANRGLLRQRSEPGLRGSAAAGGSVQLPRLTGEPGASPKDVAKDSQMKDGSFWDIGGGDSFQHGSLASWAFSHAEAARGVQAERYQQAIQESAKLSRKVRALQEQLGITSAKKDAFKAQAERLELEFRKGRDQAEQLQKELLEAKTLAGQSSKEAQESMQMMAEMRKAHIMEVRMLQRGLAARSGDDKSRNKINEVADLVDKLGRAVVQRDEATRDKTKMQAQLTRALTDLRAVSDDHGKLKSRNKRLQENLDEAKRRAKYVPPKAESQLLEDDSDPEFELELSAFERRFQILEEGPAGLDILASNLSKDKLSLEKQMKAQNETIKSLNNSIESWKKLCNEKDMNIQELNRKVENMLKERAMLEEQIEQKRREIAQMVDAEKAALEARVRELQAECDDARTAADGMEKASDRLSRELAKVHDQYTSQQKAKADEKAPAASSPAAAPAPVQGGKPPELLHASEQKVKTGETMHLEAYRDHNGAVTLHAREVGSDQETHIPISDAIEKELDKVDPWTDLFSRAGVSQGPPRQVVVSSLIHSSKVALPKYDNSNEMEPVIMTIFRYDSRRFFFSAIVLSTTQLVDLMIMEDQLSAPWAKKIDACKGNTELFDLLVTGLSLEPPGQLRFN